MADSNQTKFHYSKPKCPKTILEVIGRWSSVRSGLSMRWAIATSPRAIFPPAVIHFHLQFFKSGHLLRRQHFGDLLVHFFSNRNCCLETCAAHPAQFSFCGRHDRTNLVQLIGRQFKAIRVTGQNPRRKPIHGRGLVKFFLYHSQGEEPPKYRSSQEDPQERKNDFPGLIHWCSPPRQSPQDHRP